MPDSRTSPRLWCIARRKLRILKLCWPRAISDQLAVESRAVQGASMKILFRILLPAIALAALAVLPFTVKGQSKKPAAPKSVRLYILDCVHITGVGEVQIGFKQGQRADTRMV